ncbi:hypothetical protein M9H77_02708 [Catharanthus roseus]|uniref:Uncharacterized protein n=1 Tax=Catharanthus roseus TaxID=4058 RepID=A0ACC0C9A9_CATRO|nr:hypothetical protein M9H77_02708 [Catharanthus roseus]
MLRAYRVLSCGKHSSLQKYLATTKRARRKGGKPKYKYTITIGEFPVEVKTLLELCSSQVVSRSENSERKRKRAKNEAKTTKTEPSARNIRQPTACRGKQGIGNRHLTWTVVFTPPSAVGFLDSRIKDYDSDFDLQHGRLDYSQGCLELEKEEQSRATNLGLIRAIN